MSEEQGLLNQIFDSSRRALRVSASDDFWTGNSSLVSTNSDVARVNADGAAATQTDIGLVGPSSEPGIRMGDVVFYRSGADVATTPDSLNVGGAFDVNGATTLDGTVAIRGASLSITSPATVDTTWSFADGRNISMGSSVGTKIGTAANQKIGFYDKTPVAQQTGVAVDAAGIHAALVNLGLITA